MKNRPTAIEDSPTLSSLFTLLSAGMLLLFANFIMILFSNPEPALTWPEDVGVILWMTGFTLWLVTAVTMRKSIKRKKKAGEYMEVDKLIKTGIFSVVRHPQYLGFILFNIGFIGITQQILPSVLAVASVILIVLGIKREEQELEEKFGNKYQKYKQKTPAFNIFLGVFRLFKL
jgi:protein-S-isoprenylcysteine O-methyltransferase Ste14